MKKGKYILLVLLLLGLSAGYFIYSKLNIGYDINSISNVGNRYTIEFDNVKNSAYYLVKVKENDNVIVEDKTSDTSYEFEIDNLDYSSNYDISVSAILKNGDEEVISDGYEIIFDNLRFSSNAGITLDTTNNIITLDGSIGYNDYIIEYYKDDELIASDKVTSNSFKVNDNVLNEQAIIKALLKNQDDVLDQKEFYVNLNPVSDVKISNLYDDQYVDATTFKVEFEGGDNATSYKVILESDGKVVETLDVTDNLGDEKDLTYLDINKIYKVTLEAKYGEYVKSDTVKINLLGHYRSAIINVALPEYDAVNLGGEKFWRWYGVGGRMEWCAVFVSWAADQVGVLGVSIPKYIGCETGSRLFNNMGKYKKINKYIPVSGDAVEYTPISGDIIFFTWNDNGKTRIGHTGIVLKVEDGKVYTIEGNVTDRVVMKSYDLNYSKIAGYGTPVYPDEV